MIFNTTHAYSISARCSTLRSSSPEYHCVERYSIYRYSIQHTRILDPRQVLDSTLFLAIDKTAYDDLAGFHRVLWNPVPAVTRTHTRTQTHARARAHARTHARTHTRTQTRTYTQCSAALPPAPPPPANDWSRAGERARESANARTRARAQAFPDMSHGAHHRNAGFTDKESARAGLLGHVLRRPPPKR